MPPPPTAHIGRAVLFLASFALLIAAVVLVFGWGFDSVAVRRLVPGFAAMVPSTASCFVFGSGCVLLHHRAQPNWPVKDITRVLAIVIGVVALADLFVIAFTDASGIDALIWPAAAVFRTAAMSAATSISFMLLALCLLRLDRPLEQNDLIFVIAATVGLVLSGIALTGYAFDTKALYEIPLFTAMALHTALCFFVLFGALLLLRPEIGWVAILVGDRGGSAGARWLLPGAIALPFFLCLMALWATNAGLVNANFRLSVLAIAMMVLLTTTVLRYATVQNGIEDELRAAVGDRDLLLREVYHRVKNNLQMTTALLRLGLPQVREEASREVINATIKRVESLGLVHRLLISANVPSQLSADDYLRELCGNIGSGQAGAGTDIQIEVQAETFAIHIEAAVALGLVVNEVVTNAIKHAFVGREAGRVDVDMRLNTDGDAVLTVRDNGTGYNPANAQHKPGVGSQLIEGLVLQLDGAMRTEKDDGTRVIITIPAKTLEGHKYAK
jgi:two-component sensor histidine kinase